jgi:hypothetical protein
LHPGHINEVLTLFIVNRALGVAVKPDRARRETRTHLAVYFRWIIKAKHVEDYGHKGRNTREGVNL